MIKHVHLLLQKLKQQYRQDKEFFSAPPRLDYKFRLINPVHHAPCRFIIESLGTLDKLLEVKRINKEEPVLRFLVDMEGIAWFARENQAHIKAPKHFQMTGLPQEQAQCQTAGNIKFTDSSCRVLKSINHRSGDFQPSFHSLRLFVAILVSNEKKLSFKLPPVITVKELSIDGHIKKKHRLHLSEIHAWIQDFSADERLIQCLGEQDMPTKYVYYESYPTALA